MLNTALQGEAFGGSYRFSSEIATELAIKGWRVTLMVANIKGNMPESEVRDNVRIIRYSYCGSEKSTFNYLKHFANLKKLIRDLLGREHFELAWGHSPIESYALLKSGGRIPPLIYTLHSPWLLERKSNKGGRRISLPEATIIAHIEKTILNNAKKVHFLSKYMLEQTRKAYGNQVIDDDKVVFLPGGTHRARSKLTNSLKLPHVTDLTTFFVLRRLEPRMGLDRLIEAAAIVAARRRDFRIIIGGQGRLAPLLQQQVNQRGLANIITLIGSIPSEELDSYYALCDCVIVPTVELEGFGLVILEAFSHGKPVLGTPIGGMRDLISEHLPECLIDDTSVSSIAAKIDWFLDLPKEKRIRLGEVALRASEGYYWDKLVTRYFNELLKL